jgi:hypothetical protein
MTVVNGVERPAQDADSLTTRTRFLVLQISPSAHTTPLPHTLGGVAF